MASDLKKNIENVEEFQFYQRDTRTKWEIFQKTLYDKSSNQILGRTPFNWAQLVLFYTLFYIGLAILFTICMQGLFATLDEKAPRWKLESSLIGINPGVGFRPLSTNTDEGTLIWYNKTNSTVVKRWTKSLDSFLKAYQKNQTQSPFVNCNFNVLAKEKEVCSVQPKIFGNCSPEKYYGYNTSSPCIFLKLNRIYDWIPEYYTSPVPGMPNELIAHITNSPPDERKQVWISCNGLDDVDKENIKGFKYYPHGLASFYYPYKNTAWYLSPLVAVEVLNITANVVVSIECRAWAKNILYQGGTLNREGSVTFEIQADSGTFLP